MPEGLGTTFGSEKHNLCVRFHEWNPEAKLFPKAKRCDSSSNNNLWNMGNTFASGYELGVSQLVRKQKCFVGLPRLFSR